MLECMLILRDVPYNYKYNSARSLGWQLIS